MGEETETQVSQTAEEKKDAAVLARIIAPILAPIVGFAKKFPKVSALLAIAAVGSMTGAGGSMLSNITHGSEAEKKMDTVLAIARQDHRLMLALMGGFRELKGGPSALERHYKKEAKRIADSTEKAEREKFFGGGVTSSRSHTPVN